MSTETQVTLTEGQKRVRIKANNPNGNPSIEQVKQRYADMWDYLDQEKQKELSRTEKDTAWKQRTAREFAVAQASIESACMDAVKALTAYQWD